jgi:EEF1A lysine methyltransferase 4
MLQRLFGQECRAHSHATQRKFIGYAKAVSVFFLRVRVDAMQDDMALDGYEHIVNIDFSETCIQRMCKLNTKRQCEYIVADCRSMPEFQEGQFGCVVDKGTLDAMMCGTDVFVHVADALAEYHRVLQPGGCLILISYGHPHSRIHYLDNGLEWTVETFTVTSLPLEEAAAAANGDCGVNVEIRGPFIEPAMLRAMDVQDDIIFVYVCCKAGQPQGDIQESGIFTDDVLLPLPT